MGSADKEGQKKKDDDGTELAFRDSLTLGPGDIVFAAEIVVHISRVCPKYDLRYEELAGVVWTSDQPCPLPLFLLLKMSLDVEAANATTGVAGVDARQTAVGVRKRASHERLVKAASEYRSGCPLYSFQLALGKDFKNFRRFKTVRMRMLLVKQNSIAALERKLKTADDEEVAELRLGCLERDNNEERGRVLRELDTALKDYGK
ncbi:uncharacterized protein BKCO1_3100086 [Diplodia corticola]|uniref:DUF6594 domain-containing protein n=1 Tax=Diplodia corticola TaxID=236234 RepID=A0A1J9QYD3_9PEZI|nr:uncharacterized protein BKCO1_3100086 [Diplodia corticola]OJD33385.1 hypothetical protein BKCO1_3100086 [Diplodia corticola]